MVKVLVEFCIDADIIECPEWLVVDLQRYQKSFIEWLFDKRNEHAYWMYSNGEKNGCTYRAEAFVEWLNNFVLYKDLEKVSVLESGVSYETGIVCRAVYPECINQQAMDLREDWMSWLESSDEDGQNRYNRYIELYGNGRYFAYAFTDWLNELVLKEVDDQAYVIDKQIDIREIKNMPRINF